MKILVYDHGLNLDLALRLAQAGHTVGYYVEAGDKHSRFEVSRMGTGLEPYGLHHLDHFYDYLSKVDLICCFDCYEGELVTWLKSTYPNKRVWGAGRALTSYELDRIQAREHQKATGLPTQSYKKVQGVQALIKLLQDKSNQNLYIKCSGFRELETFFHKDWESTQVQYISPLLASYGTDPDLEFLLDSPIEPAIEVGADNIYLKGSRTTLAPFGYEAKDAGYIGNFSSKTLPPALEAVNQKFGTHGFDYNTFLSTELRVTPSKAGYLIDITARAAHPPTAAMCAVLTNLPEVITKGQQPVARTKYAAVIIGDSGWAGEHITEVEVDKQTRHLVYINKFYERDGRTYIIPSPSYTVQCMGIGPTPDQALKVAKLVCDSIKAKDLSFDYKSVDELLTKTIPEGKKYGINF